MVNEKSEASRDEFELAYLVDRFVRRIAAGLHMKAVEVDTDRVGPLGGMLLLTLSELEPTPIHKLVAQMGRDKSQMTRLINSLIEKNLIDRRMSGADRRVHILTLTERGRGLVRKLKVVLTETIDQILKPVALSDRDNLIEILRKI